VVNFTNILQAAFLFLSFVLRFFYYILGLYFIVTKAALKIFVKLTPDVIPRLKKFVLVKMGLVEFVNILFDDCHEKNSC
jgi:hypothetical protein